VFVAVTLTPGINAPVASDTVPPTVALLVCAIVKTGRSRQISATAGIEPFFMFPPTPKKKRVRMRAAIAIRIVQNLVKLSGEYSPVEEVSNLESKVVIRKPVNRMPTRR
jgi:hypothetical protein